MKLLAVETATEACSAALWLDGAVAQRLEVQPRGHARLLLPMVEALLAEAGLQLRMLDGIAFGRGPGSFTGVRIAAGVVQGLALGADLPVAPVSTLAALAEGARRETGAARVLAALDARMGEIYWGAFEERGGRMQARGAEALLRPDTPRLPAGAWHGAGHGWALLPTGLRARLAACEPERLPQARDVAVLGAGVLAGGGGVAAHEAVPVYLRDRVTHQARE